MNRGKYVFAQVMVFFPNWVFDKAVKEYKGDFHVKNLSCYSLCLHLMFRQLAGCKSLNDISLILQSLKKSVYHLGIPIAVDSSSLSKAIEARDNRIFEALGKWSNHTSVRLCQWEEVSWEPALGQVPWCWKSWGYIIHYQQYGTGTLEIANIYRNRWQIETFFKWIKGNQTIKSLWGYSENSVNVQLWIAICSYLLLAWLKAELKSPLTITEIS